MFVAAVSKLVLPTLLIATVVNVLADKVITALAKLPERIMSIT